MIAETARNRFHERMRHAEAGTVGEDETRKGVVGDQKQAGYFTAAADVEFCLLFVHGGRSEPRPGSPAAAHQGAKAEDCHHDHQCDTDRGQIEVVERRGPVLRQAFTLREGNAWWQQRRNGKQKGADGAHIVRRSGCRCKP
ncbi:MAG: hypothetical protein AAF721_24560 [Myxococcota bacterium]